MSLSALIGKIVDLFYIAPLRRLLPQTVFRYGACGVLNMGLDAVWYFLIYHFIVCKQFVDLGIVVISPHILSLVIVFPITFFTGFWLNRNVAFRATTIGRGVQLAKYLLTVAGSILLNYICMKLLVEHAAVWATPSKVITTLVCSVYSYLVGRYFTFAEPATPQK